MITTFLKTPVVFSRFSRGEAMIFPEVHPTFSTWSPPPPPPQRFGPLVRCQMVPKNKRKNVCGHNIHV